MNYALEVQEDLLTLQTTEKKQTKAQYRDYVRFLRLLKSGEAKTQEQAAKAVNLTLRQGQRIWKNYRLNGLQKLITPTQSSYIGKLSTTQMSHLRRFLMDDQASTLTDIKDYIAGSLGVEYTIGGVSDLCQRLNIKAKTGRPVHAHQPAGAVEAYKKNSNH
jgi:transposase